MVLFGDPFEGHLKVTPQKFIARLSVEGQIYSVPAREKKKRTVTISVVLNQHTYADRMIGHEV